MYCPACQSVLEAHPGPSVTADRCANCGGIWFDFGELQFLMEESGGENLQAFISVNHPSQDIALASFRFCPKDNVGLESRLLPNTELNLESCPLCNGIWLDATEFEAYTAYYSDRSVSAAPRRQKLQKQVIREAQDEREALEAIHPDQVYFHGRYDPRYSAVEMAVLNSIKKFISGL